jgi:hypothetical protein
MSTGLGNLFKRKSTAPSEPSTFDAIYAEALAAAAVCDFDRAVRLFDQAIVLDLSHAEVHYKRGNALKDLGQLEAALASYNQAIERKADYAYAYCNRGVVQHGLGLHSAALASYDQAIALQPTDALTHSNRALVLQDLCRWKEALASYDRAVALNPGYADAQYNRALTQLLLGDFENGWRGYEWRCKHAHRLRIGEARNFTQPLWLGERPLAGKRLLLHGEGGLGDTIQFCRYATLCARLGATVLLEAHRPLIELLASLEGVSELISAGSTLPPFDYHCPLMSLPLAFHTTVQTIPAPGRYLHADPAKVARWRSMLGEPRCARIGVVWSGNPNNPNRARSIALADWVAHLSPQFQYFRLQTEVSEADEAALDSSESIFSFDDDLLDFANTAALCECLDLVISVDTSIAHLSGALGRPTWVLLPFSPDWRWMLGREDSPWYPTVKLYRQETSGSWSSVFERVAADLRGQFAARAIES